MISKNLWNVSVERAPSVKVCPVLIFKDMKRIPLEGQRFGKYTVIAPLTGRKGMTVYLCKCDCGTENHVYGKHLRAGKSNGCHPCSVKRGESHVQWNGAGEISGHWWATHVAQSRTGRKKQVCVEIDVGYGWELFLNQDRKCALSGLPLTFSSTTDGTASLDRIDSNKGYISGNVQWVHKHINLMKNVFTQGYFIEMCRRVSVNVL